MPPEAPIEIVPYDSDWPARFEDEATILRRVLAPWLVGPIEHVGSTAVAGLSAKPVIDMMAAVQTLAVSRPAIAAAATSGYCYSPYQEEIEHWFCKPSFAHRTHHLHLIPLESASWVRTLAFRDYLRNNPVVSREYQALKQQLARQHRLDREAYTEAKRPFIERITSIALGARA